MPVARPSVDGHGCDFVAGGEVNAAILGGLPRGGGERARIDAALFEEKNLRLRWPRPMRAPVLRRSRVKEGCAFGADADVFCGREHRIVPWSRRSTLHPRFDFQFVGEFRIHACTGLWRAAAVQMEFREDNRPACRRRRARLRGRVLRARPQERSRRVCAGRWQSERPMMPPPMMMTSQVFTSAL